ncbi:MAG: DUF3955 domain-containing protein [Burkholderiaceae bacterium]
MKRTLFVISALFFLGVFVCGLAYNAIGQTIDENGTLREAFFLIPLAYLLGTAGIITAVAGLAWRKRRKRAPRV